MVHLGWIRYGGAPYFHWDLEACLCLLRRPVRFLLLFSLLSSFPFCVTFPIAHTDTCKRSTPRAMVNGGNLRTCIGWLASSCIGYYLVSSIPGITEAKYSGVMSQIRYRHRNGQKKRSKKKNQDCGRFAAYVRVPIRQECTDHTTLLKDQP